MAANILTRFCINEAATLKALAHTDPDILRVVAEHASGQVPSLDSDALAQAIAHDAGLDVDVTSPVLEALWPLAMVQRRLDMDTDTFIGELEKCLETEARVKWSKDDITGWGVLKPHIVNLLSGESSIASSAKAVELLMEQPLFLCRSRIVTDMRPIFNEEANQLKGMLPFHTLILRCHEGSTTNKQIHVALDASDLANLRKQVSRAEEKERYMRKSLSAAGFMTVDTSMEEEIEGGTDG